MASNQPPSPPGNTARKKNHEMKDAEEWSDIPDSDDEKDEVIGLSDDDDVVEYDLENIGDLNKRLVDSQNAVKLDEVQEVIDGAAAEDAARKTDLANIEREIEGFDTSLPDLRKMAQEPIGRPAREVVAARAVSLSSSRTGRCQ